MQKEHSEYTTYTDISRAINEFKHKGYDFESYPLIMMFLHRELEKCKELKKVCK